MKITINKVIGTSRVEVTSPIGIFVGEWMGPIPSLEDYEVELSIDEVLATKVVNAVEAVHATDDIFFLTGLIEDEDDDNIRYLRIGNDLVMLDIEGESLVNKLIEVETKNIKLFPI